MQREQTYLLWIVILQNLLKLGHGVNSEIAVESNYSFQSCKWVINLFAVDKLLTPVAAFLPLTRSLSLARSLSCMFPDHAACTGGPTTHVVRALSCQVQQPALPGGMMDCQQQTATLRVEDGTDTPPVPDPNRMPRETVLGEGGLSQWPTPFLLPLHPPSASGHGCKR